MPEGALWRRLALTLILSAAARPSLAQSAAETHGNPGFTLRAIAEVEVPASIGERETVKLAPADRVVPGDQVIYTLEIRNNGAMALPPPRVDYPIPEHMRYLDDTAAGQTPDAERQVEGDRTGRDHLDRHPRLVAEAHDRALAELPLDLEESGLQGLLPVTR